MLIEGAAFGKLQRDGENRVTAWHSLVDHMTDVAACFNRLTACNAIRRAMECSARRKLSEQDVARLAAIVFLHDIGKANSGFQAKRWTAERDIPRNWPVRIHAGHGVEAFKLFEEVSASAAIAPVTEHLRGVST